MSAPQELTAQPRGLIMADEIPGTLLLAPEVLAEPHAFYRLLHEKAPVWRVPGTVGGAHSPVVRACQMRHPNVVSAAEAFAICAPHFRWDIGAAILIAVVDIRTAMVAKIFPCTLDSIVKSAPLYLIPGVRRSLPVVAILTEARGLRSRGGRADARNSKQQKRRTSGYSCDAKPIEIHSTNSPFLNGNTARETQDAIVMPEASICQ